MARYLYTLKTSETYTPIDNRFYYSINEARKKALAYVKWSEYTDSVIIERNGRNYLFIADNGNAEYMSGEYLKKGSPIMVLNPNGTIRATYGRTRKKKTKKSRNNEYGIKGDWRPFEGM